MYSIYISQLLSLLYINIVVENASFLTGNGAGYCMALCILQTNVKNPYNYCEKLYANKRVINNQCLTKYHIFNKS